ncbi:hypothetical protein B9Z65_5413 [Elsinoe australis]|uniref:Uncharacterized protein n=1 Tax=Elsinoe australis TaxID=40998 RepID=A0A2P7ZDZ7_9PEZI|nr:hypothetical protein B9Z65_5413 [Elsinoe australis]
MALLLAPYNDSMRLGMGYNSYTQTACIDKAVLCQQRQEDEDGEPFSDSLNISYSDSIKRGTVEIAGNGNYMNEDKIKASELNAVVSVKVVNQTETIDDNCEFQGIDGVEPGKSAFNDILGNCYISGFIEGGDFTGIISMRVLDRSKTEEVKKTIRSAADYGQDEDFLVDGSFGFSGATLEALKQTETTISVSWMGGGQVKSCE